MQKICWTDHVKNWQVLQTANGGNNIIHTIKWRKANWTGHTLCRNCLLMHNIGGDIRN